MKYSSKSVFKPRARLLLQLGDQLIKNENIAVLELVKNSYDADARNVKIIMSDIDNKKKGRIEILDDGIGMDETIIKDAWLEPGSDHKANLYRKNKKSKKYGRLPIGEKGIGRFGVHKLGDKIELITRKKDDTEFVVEIDWQEFATHKYLDKAEIEVVGRTPEYFKRNRFGTRIIITQLRTKWDRRMVRDLYRALFTLSSPFKTVDHFTINFQIDKEEWLQGLIDWKEIKDFALYHFKAKIKGSEIKEFTYKFTPWDDLDRLKPKTITEESEFIQDNQTIEVTLKENKKKKVIINLDKYKIGEIDFEGYIFDRSAKVLNLITEYSTKQLKDYLDENGGIRIYRDNLRINEYGESGNDWLNLDIRRVNTPGKRISNNIILSVINLDREDSTDLIEKTNREGFVENEAYNDFKAAILYTLGLVERLRQIDKAELRDKYNPTEKEEPVLHLTGELRSYVEKKIKDNTIRDKIDQYIVSIENDYKDINNILLTSAGAGLTLGMGIHEIEKLVKSLVKAAKSEEITGDISDLIKDIQTTINNYLDLLRQTDKETFSAEYLISSALKNLSFRFKIHEIELIDEYSKVNDNFLIECPRRFFLSAFINVVDNSIYWLDRKKRNLNKVNQEFEKKILVKLFKENNGFSLLIADNGNGFTLPTAHITKPYITAKDDGLGLGLHITSQILKVLNAKLVFPDKGDYEIPEEFDNGAQVVFRFNNSES